MSTTAKFETPAGKSTDTTAKSTDATTRPKRTQSQAWDTEAYAANGRFVANLAGGVTQWLAPQPGEHILDVGCGDGVLTARFAQSGAVMTGVDSSEAMIAAARANGIDAHHVSATDLPFTRHFDAVFSNAALHWIPREQQPQLLASIHGTLKPHGRFVAEMGGQGNIAAIRTALQSVFARHGIDAEHVAASCFPSTDEYTDLLTAAGFRVDRIELIPRPTPLKTGMAEWLRTFRNAVLDLLPDDEREQAVADTVALLQPVLCDTHGNWTADYVRLRFIAIAE